MLLESLLASANVSAIKNLLFESNPKL